MTAPEKKKRQTASEKYPLEGEIRVYKNGEVVYSDEFLSKVKLSKDKSGKEEYKWIDVVFSSEWGQYLVKQKQDSDMQDVCFIIINDIAKPPQGDIKGPGVRKYIKDKFLDKATELWDIKWEEHGFVDFKVIFEPNLPVKIAQIPKVVQSGEHKGDPTYVNRQEVVLFPIEPILEPETVVTKPEDSEVDGTIEDKPDWVEETDEDIRNDS